MPPVLITKKISKKFYHPAQVTILNPLNLSIEKGETVAITGRSGQGKSTLLHVLGTLEKPCSGKLIIADQEVSFFNSGRIRNKHIAFIFQSLHLLEDYTALENVLMPARIARYSTCRGSEKHRHALYLLERVGLSERAHFNVKLLSGGEKQRVAIARALCNNPDILFADEPSGNLDKRTAYDIHHILLDFAREQEKTLVIVAHDPDLAQLCRTKYILEQGELVVIS